MYRRRIRQGGCSQGLSGHSMDGRGAWRDNVFVERLWKSLKHERVHLHTYDSVNEARGAIMQYLGLVQQIPAPFKTREKNPGRSRCRDVADS
jgi:hypothetical protein